MKGDNAMTEELFREDWYLQTCDATVTASDRDGIELDRTVFYATGGGQPGDTGWLEMADGSRVEIIDTRKDRDSGAHVHIPVDEAALPQTGDTVRAILDWDRRHRHMRMHSALHLLCSIIEGGVTGGSIGAAKGRLDFDLQDTALDKEAIGAELNRLIEADLAVTQDWISDAEMAERADMVRTMSVKPPMGQGRVRLIDIAGVDLQPCGGTHVRSSGEIGRVRVGKIENKGKRNRRVNILFDD